MTAVELPIMPQPGRLPHLVLRVLQACAAPLTRVEVLRQLARLEQHQGTLLAVERATRKFMRYGLLQLADQLGKARRFVLTARGRQVLEDLDVELWWRTTGQAAA